MTTSPAPPRRRPAVLLTLAPLAASAIGGGLLLPFAPAVAAAPGDRGTVRVHANSTPIGDPRDEMKVCRFYLEATGFESLAEATYAIEPQPRRAGAPALVGELALNGGAGHTEMLTLPDGQYRLHWDWAGRVGQSDDRYKDFEVACEPEGATGTGTGDEVDSDADTGAETGAGGFGNPAPPGYGTQPRGGVAAGEGGAAKLAAPSTASEANGRPNRAQLVTGAALAGSSLLAAGLFLTRRGRHHDDTA